MEEKRLREIIGSKLGDKTDVFVLFFQERFPNEHPSIESYVLEWVNRFNSGNPENQMDIISKNIYEKILR